MIPKIIHYAWFGTTPPPFIEARVNEWRTQLPDWEFKFWNDKNFDLSKYAFSEKCIRRANWVMRPMNCGTQFCTNTAVFIWIPI